MEAFERNPDGTFRVRHFFGADGLALLFALLVPVAMFAVVWFVLFLVGLIWGVPGEDALGAGVGV